MVKRGHIILCWEIGGNLGHIYQFSRLAKILEKKQFEVSIIVKDTSFAPVLFSNSSVSWYQSPLNGHYNQPFLPVNHADILHMHGYDTREKLIGLIAAWRNLFRLLMPTCIITEAAPTAFLAARIEGITSVGIDNGFFCPPISDPLPALRDWEPISVESLKAKEDRTLKIINDCLNFFETPLLQKFSEIIDVETVYLTWPQLSHFGYLNEESYIGSLVDNEKPRETVAQADKKNCLIYLNRYSPAAESAIRWAVKHNSKVLAYLPGWSKDQLSGFDTHKSLRISAVPLDLGVELTTAKYLICHGGAGAVSQALRSGTIPILLPNHVEQFRMYRALLKSGLTVKTINDPIFNFDESGIPSAVRCINNYNQQWNDKNPAGEVLVTRIEKAIRDSQK